MITALTTQLDIHLHYCKEYGSNTRSLARTYYDQAYGMAIMFSVMCPDLAEQVKTLWNDHYQPEFEKIVYGD